MEALEIHEHWEDLTQVLTGTILWLLWGRHIVGGRGGTSLGAQRHPLVAVVGRGGVGRPNLEALLDVLPPPFLKNILFWNYFKFTEQL